ncbi:unnamed protein product [Citrullus colocynthis]|uniref:Uncharacterized protein n=1 Tax=Citrullus colocynthis TaxID=252529 RepID=A0ABP0XXU0_9ROSI
MGASASEHKFETDIYLNKYQHPFAINKNYFINPEICKISEEAPVVDDDDDDDYFHYFNEQELYKLMEHFMH